MRCQLELSWCFQNAYILYFHFDYYCHLIEYDYFMLRLSNIDVWGFFPVFFNEYSKAALRSIYLEPKVNITYIQER